MKIHSGEFKVTPISPEELRAKGDVVPLTDVEHAIVELYKKRNATVAEKLESMKSWNHEIRSIDEQLAGMWKEYYSNQTRIKFDAVNSN